MSESDDCGQDGVCVEAPGCSRHWAERVREVMAERNKARAEVEMLRGVDCCANGDGPCGVCRKCAYRRGAEAVRMNRNDVEAERDRLLDELAEANARRDDLRTALEWSSDERDRLQRERNKARAEVERLKAQRLERHLESWEQYMQDNDVKRAFRRGAEAMRLACQEWCRGWENNGDAIADALADLRVEDKP